MIIPDKYKHIVEYYLNLIEEGKITIDDVPSKIRQYIIED